MGRYYKQLALAFALTLLWAPAARPQAIPGTVTKIRTYATQAALNAVACSSNDGAIAWVQTGGVLIGMYQCIGGAWVQILATGAGASQPFTDASALIFNGADSSKQALFSLANLTTGTTRSYILPDRTGSTLATTTGSLTNAHCVNIDAFGNLKDSGAVCASAPTLDTVLSPLASFTLDLKNFSGQFPSTGGANCVAPCAGLELFPRTTGEPHFSFGLTDANKRNFVQVMVLSSNLNDVALEAGVDGSIIGGGHVVKLFERIASPNLNHSFANMVLNTTAGTGAAGTVYASFRTDALLIEQGQTAKPATPFPGNTADNGFTTPGNYSGIYVRCINACATGVGSFTNVVAVEDNAGNEAAAVMVPAANLPALNGQVPIGSTASGAFLPATITAGANVTVTNGPGSITIASSAAGGGSASFPFDAAVITGSVANDTIQFDHACGAASLPCNIAIGNVTNHLAQNINVQLCQSSIAAAPCSSANNTVKGLFFVFLNTTGTVVVGTPNGATIVSNGAYTVQNAVTQFPSDGSIPLWTWTNNGGTGNTWDSSIVLVGNGGIDQRPYMSSWPVQGASGVSCTMTSGIVTCSAVTPVLFNNAANTGTAAMTLDMSASNVANAFKVPIGAGLTAGADGVVAYDTTGKNTVVRANGANGIVGAFASLPINLHCVSVTVAGSNVLLADAGACAGTPAFGSITSGTNSTAAMVVTTGASLAFTGTATLDMSADTSASAFKVPVIAGAAPSADGTIANNSTTHGLNVGSNGSILNVAVASTGAGGTGTSCTNQAITAISNTAGPTCTTLTSSFLPAAVVYNNAANTGTAAMTLDMSASTGATSFKPPQISGPNPSTTPSFSWDTGQSAYVYGNTVSGKETSSNMGPCLPQAVSDPLNNSSLTTEQAFATNCTIPANFFVANKVLRVIVGVDIQSTAQPTFLFKMKLGGVAVYTSTALIPSTTSATTKSGGVEFYIQGTAAVGGSVPVFTSIMHSPADTSGVNSPFSANSSPNSTSLATNGSLALTFTVTFSSITGTNSLAIKQLILEELN